MDPNNSYILTIVKNWDQFHPPGELVPVNCAGTFIQYQRITTWWYELLHVVKWNSRGCGFWFIWRLFKCTCKSVVRDDTFMEMTLIAVPWQSVPSVSEYSIVAVKIYYWCTLCSRSMLSVYILSNCLLTIEILNHHA